MAQALDDGDWPDTEESAEHMNRGDDDDSKLPATEKQEPSDWDWYCLATPSMARIGMGRGLEQRYALQDDLRLDSGWSRIDHPDYDGIFWTYSQAPSLACNGIVVPRCDDRVWRAKWGLKRPNLQVRDPNGNFPLNLQRSELQNREFPFAEQLGLDVARSFLGFALSKLPCGVDSLASALKLMRNLESPHLPRIDEISISEWFFSAGGASYLHPKLFGRADCRALLIVRIARNSGQHPHLRLPLLPTFGYMVLDQETRVDALDRWIREATNLPFGSWHFMNDFGSGKWKRVSSFLGEFHRTGTRVMLPKSAVDRFEKVKTASKAWRSVKTTEWESNGWALVSVGDCGKPIFAFQEYAEASPPENTTDTISECYFGKERGDSLRIRVAEQWLEVFGQPLIPFDADERAAKLKTAYQQLEPYMATFREPQRQGS